MPQTNNIKSNKIKSLKITEFFSLKIDKASNQEIIDDIRKDSVFKGANLWILIFAIIICSVGLDINSTAVIIGGMLISPLMGPLMGIGMGLSRNDLDLIKTSSYNIGIAVILSVLTSALYFYISPLNKVQSELLSRTSPAFWDVLIAFAGGFVGIIAYTRSEKNNVIPGVAIATALMPPLSTAGFGLAIGNYQFFWGALYLFFINSIFIAIGTYIVIRILRIRRKKYVDPIRERNVKRFVIFLVIIIIIPSFMTAVKMVKENIFEIATHKYITNEMDFENTVIISENINFNTNPKQISITLYGEHIDSSHISMLKSKMISYNLDNTELQIIQGYKNGKNLDKDFIKILKDNVKSDLMTDINSQNQGIILEKNKLIDTLKKELDSHKGVNFQINRIAKEASIIYPYLKIISINFNPTFISVNNKKGTIPTVIVQFKTPQFREDSLRFRKWLQIRLEVDSIVIMGK